MPAGNIAAYSPQQLRAAIKSVESAHVSQPYRALGKIITRPDGSKDRAYGAYQVMGANIPSWTQEVLGVALTPRQFLADERAQDAVFDVKFGQNLRRYNNFQDAASVWHSGRPLAQAQNASDGNMRTVDYVRRATKALASGYQNSYGGHEAPTPGDGTTAAEIEAGTVGGYSAPDYGQGSPRAAPPARKQYDYPYHGPPKLPEQPQPDERIAQRRQQWYASLLERPAPRATPRRTREQLPHVTLEQRIATIRDLGKKTNGAA